MFRRLQVSAGVWRNMCIRWGVALIAILTLFITGMILFSPLLTVRSIEVIRESPRLDIEQVQQTLAPLFGKKMLFLTPFEAEDLLRASITDLRDLRISKAFPGTLRISIVLDPLVARLAIASPEALDRSAAGSGASIDFLTSEGVYVRTSSVQDGDTFPEITLVDWGVRPQPGTVILPPQFLERMNAAEVVLLRQFGEEVRKRVAYVRAQEFHLLLGNNRFLWFDLRSPIDKQAERYRIFLKEIGPEKAKEYVDLRIEGRVVYK